MPNKKISQLSGISPVPTGALMVLANSGVSRSATVKDIAEAVQGESVTTWSGLSDTPADITGNMFVMGHSDAHGLTFSNDAGILTGGYWLDKRYGGIVSGDVTMAAGDTIYLNDNAFNKNYISHGGTGVVVIGAGKLLKIVSPTGLVIYGDGPLDSAITLVNATSDAGLALGYKLSLNDQNLVLSGEGNTIIQSVSDHTKGLDVSGRYYQSGVEINFGDFFKSGQGFTGLDDTPNSYHLPGGAPGDTVAGSGIIVNAAGDGLEFLNTGFYFVGHWQTGGFIDTNMTGNFLDINYDSGKFVPRTETGLFVSGSGVAGHYTKWAEKQILTSGIFLDDGTHLYPASGGGGLGSSANRWSGINARTIDILQGGYDPATQVGFGANITAKSSYTGYVSTNIFLRNSNDDSLKMGISSTGKIDSIYNNSGDSYIYSSNTGYPFHIGNKSQLNIYANQLTGYNEVDVEPSIELSNEDPYTISLNKQVTFSKAFTFPTEDGTTNTPILMTDGAGTVTWGNHFSGYITGLWDVNVDASTKIPQGGYGNPLDSLVVDPAGNGMIWSGVAGGGAGTAVSVFTTSLTDTPSSYSSPPAGGRLVGVKDTEDGLEFIPTGDFVGAGETGDFLTQYLLNNKFPWGPSGPFNHAYTGYLMDIQDSGVLVNTDMTGGFMDLNDSGFFITQTKLDDVTDKAYTGHFIASGVVFTGAFSDYCAEYNIGIHSSHKISVRETSPLGPAHPEGNSDTLAGAQRNQPDLFLQKGCTYKFNVTGSNVTNAHFGISTGLLGTHNVAPYPITWSKYLYESGQFGGDDITDTRAAANGQSLYFRVPQTAPNTLYYNAFTSSDPSSASLLPGYGGTIKFYDDSRVGHDETGYLLDSGYSGTFIGLQDTPNLYAGFGGSGLVVNAAEDELEYFHTGIFVGTGETGQFLDKLDSGVFYSRYGGPITGDVTILGSANNAFKIKNTNNSYELDAVVINDSGIFLSGAMEIRDGASHHKPVSGAGTTINWSQSNVQFKDVAASTDFSFTNVKDGQTLTMYVKNTSASLIDCTFMSGAPATTAANRVKMPMDALGSTDAPQIQIKKANVYTFVRINTGIFTSYITGYDFID